MSSRILLIASLLLNFNFFYCVVVCDLLSITADYDLASFHELRERVATFIRRPLDGALLRGLGASVSSWLRRGTVDNRIIPKVLSELSLLFFASFQGPMTLIII